MGKLLKKNFLFESSLPVDVEGSSNTVGLATDATITDAADQVGLLIDAMSTHGSLSINRPYDSTCPDCAYGS